MLNHNYIITNGNFFFWNWFREKERSGTIDVKIKVNYGPLGLNFEASERNILTFLIRAGVWPK